MITVHVPVMTARQDVRAISAVISDVPGVRTLRADLATRTVQVTGPADPAAVTAAVTATGYAVEEPTAHAADGSPISGTPRPGGRPVNTFPSTDLPEATRRRLPRGRGTRAPTAGLPPDLGTPTTSDDVPDRPRPEELR